MKLKPLPSQEQLRQALSYDPDTGIFTWKFRADMHAIWNRKCAGKQAGCVHQKAVIIYFNNIQYSAHRLAWVYVHGDVLDAATHIDHKNCNCHDNRLLNLRPATHGQNASNSRRRSKKKLAKGVSVNRRGNYRARIGIDKGVLYLGTFKTEAEAHAAYCAAAIKAKGEFARAE